jgi:hypothetical protein
MHEKRFVVNIHILSKLIRKPSVSDKLPPSVTERVALDIDNAADALELHRLNPDNDNAAIELVGGWMRMKRMNQEILKTHDNDDVFSKITVYITQKSSSLFQQLAECLNPSGWLDETRTFLDAHLAQELSEEESEQVFLHLFRDYDDCALILAGIPSVDDAWSQITNEMLECRRFIAENPDVFLPVCHYVREWAMAIRQDLDEFDPNLELTLLPFIATLEQMAQMDAEEADELIFNAAETREIAAMLAPRVISFFDQARELVAAAVKTITVRLKPETFTPPENVFGTGSGVISAPRVKPVTWRYPDEMIAVRLNLSAPSPSEPDNVRLVTFDAEAEWLFFAGMLFQIETLEEGLRGAVCSRRIIERTAETSHENLGAVAILTHSGVIRTALLDINAATEES